MFCEAVTLWDGVGVSDGVEVDVKFTDAVDDIDAVADELPVVDCELVNEGE